MKPLKKTIILSIAAALTVPMLAQAQTVRNKPTCDVAIKDAKTALKGAAISNKARENVDGLIRDAENMCLQSNFSSAESLLQVARGMSAEE